ncbi:GNAT family N-acetyltransferase [Clostridium chromiireducens]|uniref:GNAT family N-acetyltransferase n=1 Tax=Clostridium chromiireducens TaxID=225345 RepID=A0A399ITH2_9CLOT|nr:GNAT family N-acetyltransferase [Clostridium chromiireducens]RII35847.1 GNAT family N-acetyltransferase [Clostridium chromiireducens]
MKFRQSVKKDVDRIMEIIEQAQNYFKEQGIDQWQNGYPNPEVILNDIDNGHSYVLVKDNKIIATAAVSFDGEITYNTIYNGKWLSNNEFTVVHRVAVDNAYKGQGLSSVILNNVKEICLEKDMYSIKIDTHKENISMQNLLKKNGFEYCGVILLENKSERVAFEKILV